MVPRAWHWKLNRWRAQHPCMYSMHHAPWHCRPCAGRCYRGLGRGALRPWPAYPSWSTQAAPCRWARGGPGACHLGPLHPRLPRESQSRVPDPVVRLCVFYQTVYWPAQMATNRVERILLHVLYVNPLSQHVSFVLPRWRHMCGDHCASKLVRRVAFRTEHVVNGTIPAGGNLTSTFAATQCTS